MRQGNANARPSSISLTAWRQSHFKRATGLSTLHRPNPLSRSRWPSPRDVVGGPRRARGQDREAGAGLLIRVAESPIVALALFVALGLAAFWIVPALFLVADRPCLEDYGICRDWRLRRVWVLPLPQGKSGRTYYRATVVTADGSKRTVWFRVTDGEPVGHIRSFI